MAENTAAAFQGLCSLCGWTGEWEIVPGTSLRENFRCRGCKASLKYRDQAAAILNFIGDGRYATWRDMQRAGGFTRLAIYEVALRTPFSRFLSAGCRDYVQSYLWMDRAPGEVKDGIRCEDVTNLTLPSRRFDLVISSDVMEHIFDYRKGFREIFRVLKPGGYHIFTSAMNWPLADVTVERASEHNGEIVQIGAPQFRKSGDGSPSLVCSEFGRDLLDKLGDIGFDAWFLRPSVTVHPMHRNAVVVARRPPLRRRAAA